MAMALVASCHGVIFAKVLHQVAELLHNLLAFLVIKVLQKLEPKLYRNLMIYVKQRIPLMLSNCSIEICEHSGLVQVTIILTK